MGNGSRFGFFAFSLLLAVACAKDKEEDKEEAPPGPSAVFDPTQLTATDVTGAVVGTADPTDWRTDDTFATWEQALFGAGVIGDLQPTSANNYVRFWANPVQSGLANFEMGSPSAMELIKLAYVDRYGSTIAAHQYGNSGTVFNVVFDLLSTGGLHDGQSYRLYYQALNEDSLVVLQGHGDFQMNN